MCVHVWACMLCIHGCMGVCMCLYVPLLVHLCDSEETPLALILHLLHTVD